MRAWSDEAIGDVIIDGVVCPTCCASAISARAAAEAACDSCGARFDEETLTALAESLTGDGALRGAELASAVASLYPSYRVALAR